jgi:hypothetical protein
MRTTWVGGPLNFEAGTIGRTFFRSPGLGFWEGHGFRAILG